MQIAVQSSSAQIQTVILNILRTIEEKQTSPCRLLSKVITSCFALHYFTKLLNGYGGAAVAKINTQSVKRSPVERVLKINSVTCSDEQIELVSGPLMKWSRHVLPVLQIRIDFTLKCKGSQKLRSLRRQRKSQIHPDRFTTPTPRQTGVLPR